MPIFQMPFSQNQTKNDNYSKKGDNKFAKNKSFVKLNLKKSFTADKNDLTRENTV